MNSETSTQNKKGLIELWRHDVVMPRWRMGLLVASVVLMVVGCTPLC